MVRCSIGRTFTVVLLTIIIILVITQLPDPSPRYSSYLDLHPPPPRKAKPFRAIQKGLPLLKPSAISKLETFVFFVGYPRSGHSIVASCLDAHPDAVIAHEYNLFAKLLQPEMQQQLLNRSTLFSSLYQNSLKQSQIGWRSNLQKFSRKGYSLKLNSSKSWQGKFRNLKVIGDKSGGMTTHIYRDMPKDFLKVYSALARTVQVPIKVLHIVRNPYDIIATKLLYRLSMEKSKTKANFSADNPLTDSQAMMQAAKALESEAKAVYELTVQVKLFKDVLEIHNADFILKTEETLKRLCQFLDLDCSQKFLELCRSVVYNKPNKSRVAIQWSTPVRRFIDKKIIERYPFFSRYSIESD